MEQDQRNREVPLVWQCSSQPRTAECFAHQDPLLFRLAQIFGDNIPTIILFHVQLTYDDHSNSQLTITIHHLFYPLDYEGLSLLYSSFNTSLLYLNLLYHSKTRVPGRILSPYTCRNILSVMSFPQPNQKISDLFVPQCL